MSYELRGRVVFITGASRGIGRACALEYHRAGCNVVAAARSADLLNELVDELGSDRIVHAVVDVTDARQRAEALASARERFGAIDILLNNAGWASFASVLRLPGAHLERMWGLNFAAPVALIQEVLPEMIQRRSGQIVNVSSVVGSQAIPRMGVYGATKAALSSLSTALRMELQGTGVDVLLVSPGSTATGFFEAAASVDVRAVRLAETQYSPDKVARAIVRSSRLRRREVTLSAEGKAICAIRRVSHRLADAIMYRVAKRSMPPLKH